MVKQQEQHADALEPMVEQYFSIVQTLLSTTLTDWLKLELSMAQLKVLFTLAHEPLATVGRVAEAIGIGLPTASHLVERLVQAGLVERSENPADRRYTLVQLTLQGEQVVGRLRQGQRDHLCAWLLQLTSEECSMLQHGIQALARVAEASSSEGRDMSHIE